MSSCATPEYAVRPTPVPDESAAALQTAVREAIRADEPTLIEVPVDVMPNPWRILGIR